MDPDEQAPPAKSLPFPSSLCHLCGAPPRLVATDRGSVFIQCPILKSYPPQPVRSCASFTPKMA